MGENVRHFIRFQMLLNSLWQMVGSLTNVIDITAWTNKVVYNKGFGIGSFILNISATLNGVKQPLYLNFYNVICITY